jgi:hypothetical protein
MGLLENITVVDSDKICDKILAAYRTTSVYVSQGKCIVFYGTCCYYFFRCVMLLDFKYQIAVNLKSQSFNAEEISGRPE